LEVRLLTAQLDHLLACPSEIQWVKPGLEMRVWVPDRYRVEIVIHGGEADRALRNNAYYPERSTRRARIHLVFRTA